MKTYDLLLETQHSQQDQPRELLNSQKINPARDWVPCIVNNVVPILDPDPDLEIKTDINMFGMGPKLKFKKDKKLSVKEKTPNLKITGNRFVPTED